MPDINGRISFDQLPAPVRRAALALQSAMHHHTSYTQAQITFIDLRHPNEFVKPIIDTRGPATQEGHQ